MNYTAYTFDRDDGALLSISPLPSHTDLYLREVVYPRLWQWAVDGYRVVIQGRDMHAPAE